MYIATDGEKMLARARVTIHQERPYDFDDKSGLWQFRPVDEDVEVWNILTDAGRVTLHGSCYGTAPRTNGFNFIGLSNDGVAPASSDTLLASELVGNGLTRSAGTVTLPTGSGNQTVIAKTFTYSGGGSQSIQKAALFDADSDGNMNHEIQFSIRTLFTNDTLTLTYTVTLG